MRFINTYQGISDHANVTMSTVYMDTYPHIVIVCKEDIPPGQELLLDYGEGYINHFLKTPERTNVSENVDWGELPMCL